MADIKRTRFDYVAYDRHAKTTSDVLKDHFIILDGLIDKLLSPSRARSLAETKMEECFMWVGKAIRDDQVKRDANTQLQKGRDEAS